MGLILRERRGAVWKQGWAEQTLMSISPPPLQLLSLLAIIFLLLYLSSYPTYKYQVEKTTNNLKVFLLFMPVMLIFVAVGISRWQRFASRYYGRTKRNYYLGGGFGGDFPWGVVLFVVILLVLVSKQSYFHSLWYPRIWGSG